MKVRSYPTENNPGRSIVIEIIPYRECVTTESHILCCYYKKSVDADKPALEELRNEGWRIEAVHRNTLDNIARMMIANTRFSEKTLSELNIWNLFVPVSAYKGYWDIVKASGKKPEDYILH